MSAWDAIGSQAFSAAGLTPAEGHAIFAYVAIAVYDSVMAIEGGYEPFAVDLERPHGASPEAAVAAAAHRVLAHYLPAQAPTILDPAYQASLATIPDGQARPTASPSATRSRTRCMALRADDGFRAAVTYTPPTRRSPASGSRPRRRRRRHLPRLDATVQPRVRRPVPAGRAAALDSRAVGTRLQRGQGDRLQHQHHPYRRADARRRFWAEPPVQQAPWPLRRVLADHELDIVDAARIMAMISVTYADSIIACFDAKYHYAFWRPITGDPAGDTDGNEHDRRRPGLGSPAARDAEPPRLPQRPLVHHPGRRHALIAGSSARGTSTSPSPA